MVKVPRPAAVKLQDKDAKCDKGQPGGRCMGTPTGQGAVATASSSRLHTKKHQRVSNMQEMQGPDDFNGIVSVGQATALTASRKLAS